MKEKMRKIRGKLEGKIEGDNGGKLRRKSGKK